MPAAQGAPLAGAFVNIERHLIKPDWALRIVGHDERDVASYRHHRVGPVGQALPSAERMGVDVRDDLLPALLADSEQAGKRRARHIHRVARKRLGVEGFVRHEGVNGSQPILSGSAEQESAAFPAPGTDCF